MLKSDVLNNYKVFRTKCIETHNSINSTTTVTFLHRMTAVWSNEVDEGGTHGAFDFGTIRKGELSRRGMETESRRSAEEEGRKKVCNGTRKS